MTSGEHEIWARLRAVEHEASAARQLAAAAYEEVGSLAAGVRANTSLLNALRETQVEQGFGLSSLRETQVEQGFGLSSLRETQVEQGFGLSSLRETQVEQGFGLSSLRETQVEQGLGLSSLRETQVEQGLRLDSLESEVRTGFVLTGQGISTIVAMLEGMTPAS